MEYNIINKTKLSVRNSIMRNSSKEGLSPGEGRCDHLVTQRYGSRDTPEKEKRKMVNLAFSHTPLPDHSVRLPIKDYFRAQV